MSGTILQVGTNTDGVKKAQRELLGILTPDTAFAVMGVSVKADFVDIASTKFVVFSAMDNGRRILQQMQSIRFSVNAAGGAEFEEGDVIPMNAGYRGEGYRATRVVVQAGAKLLSPQGGILRSRPVGQMIVVSLGTFIENGRPSENVVFGVPVHQAGKVQIGENDKLVTDRPAEYGEFFISSVLATANTSVELIMVDRGHKGLPLRSKVDPKSDNIWDWPPDIIESALGQMTAIVTEAIKLPAGDRRSPHLVAQTTESGLHDMLATVDLPEEDAAQLEASVETMDNIVLVPYDYVPDILRPMARYVWDLRNLSDRWYGDQAVLLSPLVYPDNGVLSYETLDFSVPVKPVQKPRVNALDWLFR